MENENFVNIEGYRYWYERKLASNGDICIATTDPKVFCNGLFTYSSKDPGDGLEFVVIKTDNPEYISPSIEYART